MSNKPKTIDDIRCLECGQPRINVETGSVCPNGHGKIYEPNPLRLDRAALAEMYLKAKPAVWDKHRKAWIVFGEEFVKMGRCSWRAMPRDARSGDICGHTPRLNLIWLRPKVKDETLKNETHVKQNSKTD